jgi:hypothetical protein
MSLEDLRNKTLAFAINQVTNKIAYVTDTAILLRDLNTLKSDWVLNYTDFSSEVFNIQWSCKDALICPIIYLNMWAVVFNKKFLIFIENNARYSKLFTLDGNYVSLQVLQYSNEIFALKEDRRSFK